MIALVPAIVVGLGGVAVGDGFRGGDDLAVVLGAAVIALGFFARWIIVREMFGGRR